MTHEQFSKLGGLAFACPGTEGVNPESLGMFLLDYFAAHEVTSPPENFMQVELGNGLAKTLGPKGQHMKAPEPTPAEVAAMLAKWRYICAEAMLNERQRRGA